MKKMYMMEDLDCANCAAEIENDIRKISGVTSASLSFMTGRLVVELDGDPDAFTEQIRKVCLRVEPECVVR